MPAQYNKIRWEKKLISNLQMMMVNIWNERCKIVTAANIDTNEMRYRQKAWEFICDIRENKWKLTHDSAHLLDRDEWFFKSSSLINVQNWYDNITVAVDRGDRKHVGVYWEIRKFFDREAGFVKVRNKCHQLKESTRIELNRIKNAVQQNLVNIFRSSPGLGR